MDLSLCGSLSVVYMSGKNVLLKDTNKHEDLLFVVRISNDYNTLYMLLIHWQAFLKQRAPYCTEEHDFDGKKGFICKCITIYKHAWTFWYVCMLWQQKINNKKNNKNTLNLSLTLMSSTSMWKEHKNIFEVSGYTDSRDTLFNGATVNTPGAQRTTQWCVYKDSFLQETGCWTSMGSQQCGSISLVSSRGLRDLITSLRCVL